MQKIFVSRKQSDIAQAQYRKKLRHMWLIKNRIWFIVYKIRTRTAVKISLVTASKVWRKNVADFYLKRH